MFQNKSCNLCFLDALIQFHSTQQKQTWEKQHPLPSIQVSISPVTKSVKDRWARKSSQHCHVVCVEKTTWSSVPSFHSRLSWTQIPGSKKGATIQRPHVCNQKMHQDISRSIHFFQVRTSGCQSAFDAQPFWPPRSTSQLQHHLDHPLGLVILKFVSLGI